MLHAAGFCCLCRPLPASNALSKSTSLGSAGQLHPAQAQPNMLDEGEDVVAEQPMQSPFGSPPPPDLPERHLGPAVQEDHSLDVRVASGSLLSPAARDSSYTFVSHSGSETGRVSLLAGPLRCHSASRLKAVKHTTLLHHCGAIRACCTAHGAMYNINQDI